MLSPGDGRGIAASRRTLSPQRPAECCRTLHVVAMRHCSTMPTSSTARTPKEGCCWPRVRLQRRALPTSHGSAATARHKHGRTAARATLSTGRPLNTRRRAQSADFLTLVIPFLASNFSKKALTAQKIACGAQRGLRRTGWGRILTPSWSHTPVRFHAPCPPRALAGADGAAAVQSWAHLIV